MKQKSNKVGLDATKVSIIGAEYIQNLLKTEQIMTSLSKTGAVSLVGKRQADKVSELLRSYMQKLTDDGKMLRLSEVKKLDILDTTNFLIPPDNGYGLPSFSPNATNAEREIIDRMGWYSLIPCFEKGALKVNTFRYIVFEIKKLDPENQSITLILNDYMRQPNGFWQIGVGTTVKIIPAESTEDSKYSGQMIYENKRNFVHLYKMYGKNALKWSDADYKIWEDYVINNSRQAEKLLNDRSNTDQCEELAKAFVYIIMKCNAMLETNKPSRPINHTKSAKITQKYTVSDAGHAKRKIRNVGALRVQSEKPPRKPSLETIVTYKTAKWNVRGHIRRYKNGKTVYIKPTTKSRKALADTDKVTATTIRFKKSMKGNN